MDLSCIISSGDLELYVLGMLSSEDAYKIEQLAQLFPEIKAELDEIEEALISTANASEIAPSAAVKESLFSKLKTLQPVTATTDTLIPDEDQATAKVVPMYHPKQRSGGLAAASVIAILIAVGSIIYAVVANNQNQKKIAAVQTKADSLQTTALAQQNRISEYSNTLRFYQDTAYKTINLLPAPNRPKDILVQVFWNTQTKAVYATNLSLPQAPAGKQYQLWAFVDGKPVSAGLFDERRGAIEQMNNFNQPQAFAITLENAGGVASPTLSELYVIGNVTGKSS